jgi:hypothetical protein
MISRSLSGSILTRTKEEHNDKPLGIGVPPVAHPKWVGHLWILRRASECSPACMGSVSPSFVDSLQT